MAMVAPPNSGGVAAAALADAVAGVAVGVTAVDVTPVDVTEADGDAPFSASSLQPGASAAAQTIKVIKEPSPFAMVFFINARR